MEKLRLSSIFLLVIYFTSIEPKCSNEIHGLYCLNLTGDENNILVFNMTEKTLNTSVKSVFLRNSSGDISNSSFVIFNNVDSLDIQFSSIKKFSSGSKSLDTLYLIKNYKFPNLTEDLFKSCCQNLTTLFIANNQGLFVENGAFKNSITLHHLTITGQNITNLTKNLLEGLDELDYLDLQGNGIKYIAGDTFLDLERLNHLVLSHNPIINFEINTFIGLRNLESLDLLGLDLEGFDSTLFTNQHELKYIGIPSKLVKEKLQLQELTKTFRKLERIGLLYKDMNDTLISDFVKTCRYSGFEIKITIPDHF
ncbi:uncharacterized protein [Leptinotarsa decemlineata]|uniref:uncharacterized protein n=1 Tax=Leptinotarsa decemlineata TaxID=7539 RepID=UPI003D30C2C1